MSIKKIDKYFGSYLEDTSNIKGSAQALYIPANIDELQFLLGDCIKTNTPITLTAGRTGTTGGCVAKNGVVLSLERFNKLNLLDRKNKIMFVQAGVTLEDIEKTANQSCLSLRASPTESLAYIGGAIATGASGVRGYGYGSIRNYVTAIDVLLITGELLHIARGNFFAKKRKFNVTIGQKNLCFELPSFSSLPNKTQAGYFIRDGMDLIDLFIGSEGTLGIITSVQISLQDVPCAVFDGLIFFSDESDAFRLVEFLQDKKKSGRPDGIISLEFFDENSLNLLRNEYSYIPDARAALYFEQEVYDKTDTVSVMEDWHELLMIHNAMLENSIFAETNQERKKIFEFRHKLPQMINEFLRHNKQCKVASDCAVPQRQFKKMYEFYKEVGKQSGLDYVNFGHIGESHLHFNFLSKNDIEQTIAQEYLMRICKKAVSLGGTVSAEHGIGKIKKSYLKTMYTRTQIIEMAKLKKYFDPYCLLNLDNIFDKELLYGI